MAYVVTGESPICEAARQSAPSPPDYKPWGLGRSTVWTWRRVVRLYGLGLVYDWCNRDQDAEARQTIRRTLIGGRRPCTGPRRRARPGRTGPSFLSPLATRHSLRFNGCRLLTTCRVPMPSLFAHASPRTPVGSPSMPAGRVTAPPTRQGVNMLRRATLPAASDPERNGKGPLTSTSRTLETWLARSTPRYVRLFICPSPGESRSSERRSGGTPAARSSSLPSASLATGRRPLCRAGRPSRDLGFLLVSPLELWLCFRPSAPASF